MFVCAICKTVYFTYLVLYIPDLGAGGNSVRRCRIAVGPNTTAIGPMLTFGQWARTAALEPQVTFIARVPPACTQPYNAGCIQACTQPYNAGGIQRRSHSQGGVPSRPYDPYIYRERERETHHMYPHNMITSIHIYNHTYIYIYTYTCTQI